MMSLTHDYFQSLLFLFLSDLIQSEILSKNNLDFLSDDLLLNQLSDGPLKMEDISFDYFNLPNTLEYLNHQSNGGENMYKPSPTPERYSAIENSGGTAANPHQRFASQGTTGAPDNFRFSGSRNSVSQEAKTVSGQKQQVRGSFATRPDQKSNVSNAQRSKISQNPNKSISYHVPVGMQGQVTFQGQSTFVLAPQVKQQPILKFTAPKNPNRTKPLVTVPITAEQMQQVLLFFFYRSLS